MDYKKSGRLTGIAFIIATAAGVISVPLTSIINEENFLLKISESPNKLIASAFLIIIMGLACASIAMTIYPILSKHQKGLAIGALGFRIVEAAAFIISASTIAVLVIIGKEFALADSAKMTGLQIAGDVVKSAHSVIASNASFPFCIGALLYYIGFYKTKLVPNWLSIWGIIAILLHLVSCASVLFGTDAFSTVSLGLNMPIALQEMVMAVWLLIFGFSEQASA